MKYEFINKAIRVHNYRLIFVGKFKWKMNILTGKVNGFENLLTLKNIVTKYI